MLQVLCLACCRGKRIGLPVIYSIVLNYDLTYSWMLDNETEPGEEHFLLWKIRDLQY